MMSRRTFLASLTAMACGLFICSTRGANAAAQTPSSTPAPAGAAPPRKVVKSDDEWRKQLTPEQYAVLRKQGTERAFTGKWWDNHAKGIYVCAGCATPVFSSDTKFESGTGWPSFWAPIEPNVATEVDHGFFTTRTEVHCAVCGGHLGHVFDDGPQPTGLRYCINSVSLQFQVAQ